MRSIRLAYLTILTAAIAGCEKKPTADTTASSHTVVSVAKVQSLQPSLPIVLPGELKAWNRTLIVGKVKGYVGKLYVDRGSRVKKGQPLAELEAPEVLAALNQARAQVSSAQASLIEHRAKQKVSAATYRRIVETNRTEGAVSANELDMAYARMMSDSALAEASAQNLEAARAQMASQQQLVAYLSVRAPFDGTITERNISPGDLVGADGNKPLFILEDKSRLRLTVAIPENLANALSENSSVSFTVQADPSKSYEAHFARSSNSVDEKNRSMLAEFDFENTDDNLKAGMYAEVRLPITRNKPTLFVPRTSIIHSTEGVFLVRVNNQTAEWVAVQKGNSLDSLVEVFGPVKEGEQIVKSASEELRNGQAISLN
ncbi:efflux RND transporter periplasmic adaptor subunit [Chryseolinea sp. T2]|uniref:efflux RND transporter periplasmic adaptor subunit n=1 Tax=Chryseolinea sp. T2 TaxID=3129255 RepID=UPI0030785A31